MLAILAITLSSCKNDTGQGAGQEMQVLGYVSQLDGREGFTVKAIVMDTDAELASSAVSDGMFSLTLPATVPSELLVAMDDNENIHEGINVSTAGVMMAFVEFQVFHEEQYVGDIYLGSFKDLGDHKRETTTILYAYSNKSFTVKGGYIVEIPNHLTYSINVSYAQYWNRYSQTKVEDLISFSATVTDSNQIPADVSWSFIAD